MIKFLTPLAKCILLALLTGSTVFCRAQQNPPATGGAPPAKAVTQNQELFTSLDGRFRIALPAQVSGFSSPSVDTPAGQIKGTAFNWRTGLGAYTVTFFDRPGQSEANSKFVFDAIRDQAQVKLKAANEAGKFSERDVSIGGHPGRELRLNSDKILVVVRIYLDGQRMYQVTAFAARDIQFGEAETAAAVRKQDAEMLKVLDSFQLITPAEVATVRAQQARQATPEPLPQTPLTAKRKSDAQDEGLTGKIKMVVSEVEDLSETWEVQGRKPSATDYYNEAGYLVKSESYDYRGNLSDIEVYGYLDGQRAMKSKSIEREYNPPPMAAPPAVASKPQSQYDQRYSYKFDYKYDDAGHLSEKIYYGNSGKVWLRYVYKRKGSELEELVYAADGSLNQRYVSTLDGRGNEVQQTIYNVRDNSVGSRWKYAYEFDAQGNWTRRTAQRQDVTEGEKDYTPADIVYRTITYY